MSYDTPEGRKSRLRKCEDLLLDELDDLDDLDRRLANSEHSGAPGTDEDAIGENEERLNLSLRSGQIGTFYWNVQDGTHFWDDRMHEIWGLKPGTYQGTMDTDFFDSLHPDDAQRVNEAIRRTLEEDDDYDIDYRIIHPDKTIRHVHALATLIRDEQGRPSRLIGDCLDISERKRMEEALNEQLRQAQKMEAVGQLTGGLAHDFNNLLAVINGFLELAADRGGLEDDIREMLNRAMEAVDRGANLTDQLLSFSRRQTLNPKIGHANILISEMARLLERTLGEDIEIRTGFAGDLPLINVDHGMLGNAILNLANNARDAMPRGGKLLIVTSIVELDSEFTKDDGVAASRPHVMIAVSDEGGGMDAETLNHVFDPFYTTKGVGEGSGLGLSMVYGFVKQSGGHVTIDSKRGKGTTVRLYFPAAGDQPEDTEEKAASPKADMKGKETILVVEDDEDVRHITAAMLEQLGYEVLEAENGPSALKVLDQEGVSVDLVFSDMIMPSGMSGVDLADELQRHYQHIKVLMTSGYPEKVIDGVGIDGTGVTLLRKPYKKTQLAAAVRGALDQ